MKRVENWKWVVIFIVLVMSVIISLPTTGLLKNAPESITKHLPGKVNLGLDLQGGMHVVLEADVEAMKQKLQETNSTFDDRILAEKMDQALSIIRNRVDKFGVTEPTIQKQGKTRIVIELPGVKDPQRVLDLVGKTAYMEFKLVSDIPASEFIDDKGQQIPGKVLPPNMSIHYMRDKKTNALVNPLVLRKDIVVPGGELDTVYVQMNQNKVGYVVDFSLKREGAKQFAKITSQYTGKMLAIVLDDVIVSAPRINSEIPDGRGMIEGNFSAEEAQDLSLILKTGALPVPLKIVENRTVGASLGSDSVQDGLKGILYGCLAVILFMIIYYKLSGLVADIAVVFNVIIIVAVMVLFHGTLTLPGMAGIVLTMGMAVDANVLIYERIKEELRGGKSIGKAVDNGFDRAFITILDANLTTIITCIVLYYLGTGPVRGFAVTLMIGIAASMFTAVFVSRAIFTAMLYKKQSGSLSI